MVATTAEVDGHSGWRAQLRLGFEATRRRTDLVHRRHDGPLMVQSPFYPEGPVCHLYVLHPPGGVVGGDQLSLTAHVGERAHALITTPAATKLYRSAGQAARLEHALRLGEHGTLEWLPQENLAFAGAFAQIQTRVHVASSSRFIGWDAVCLGRPAAGERFDRGAIRQDLELWRDGQPLLIERNHLAAEARLMSATWGLSGRCTLATFIAYPSGEHLLQAARAVLSKLALGAAAASEVDGLLVCRALAGSTLELRAMLIALWSAIRPLLLHREPCAPRIWAT